MIEKRLFARAMLVVCSFAHVAVAGNPKGIDTRFAWSQCIGRLLGASAANPEQNNGGDQDQGRK